MQIRRWHFANGHPSRLLHQPHDHRLLPAPVRAAGTQMGDRQAPYLAKSGQGLAVAQTSPARERRVSSLPRGGGPDSGRILRKNAHASRPNSSWHCCQLQVEGDETSLSPGPRFQCLPSSQSAASDRSQVMLPICHRSPEGIARPRRQTTAETGHREPTSYTTRTDRRRTRSLPIQWRTSASPLCPPVLRSVR